MRKLIFTSAILILTFPYMISQNLTPDYLHGMKYRNIGPSNQGGRIVDIDAHNDDFTKVIMLNYNSKL